MRFAQHIVKRAVAIFATTLVGVLASAGGAAAAPACVPAKVADASFTICAFNPAKSDIRLFWRDSNGDAYAGLDRLAEDVAAKGGRLVFAMNAGMYQPDLSPVGLYIEKGEEVRPINRRAGSGNFGMLPNGIFWVRGQTAGVTETKKFAAQNMRPDYATQSGPMLVIGGKIHPKIHPDGVSEKTRNGVGTCDDGLVRFIIADTPVTFYTFATIFLSLKCNDALFLDGSISALYAPDIKRNDGWKSIGPIVGVVEGLKK
ncbi:MAG: phosphodiester glycosidase family protein [Rhodoblastus sp.]